MVYILKSKIIWFTGLSGSGKTTLSKYLSKKLKNKKFRVKKIDGEIKDVSIKRGLVELEELYAKSTLISKDNKNYGYISLPKFYVDFSDKNSRNSANDV